MNKKSTRKANKDGGNDAPQRKKSPLISMLLLLLILPAAAFLHPQTRAKTAAILASAKHIIAVIKENPAPGTEKSTPGVSDAALKFQNALVAKFTELELRDNDYSIQYFPKDSAIEIKASVPRGRPTEWVIWNLSAVAPQPTYRVDDCVCASEANCTITFKSSNPKQPKVVLKIQQSNRYMSNTAKMAILIENFGFEADASTAEYLSFPEPLTVALVPARKLATWTAQIADEYKKEIVMLLPMEPLPQQYDKYKESMVMIHYSDDNIRGLIAQAAAAIPNFAGICNFHGGKVMEDSRALGIILSEVNKRKAYFVYTDISKKSVAPQLTKSTKTPSAPVQGTIDAGLSLEQARERLRRYAIAAEKTGKILIKAQPSPAFIKALKEEAETMKKNGIRLVYVSELTK
ncbi:MAG: divergent polysaccharide deacetylase family protein [Chitinispirillales bacterium]|jgi:polysaccharide deacetylase 2 family uncharacterized protein YibQ|nr:divergent polysaccharide deacetylase family protein [Chitinispirillales bacterium]